MKHLELTPTERADVLAYWRDFVLSGGEGEPPSMFMLDGLNDEVVRDTFLFWQVGGNPFGTENSPWKDDPGVEAALAVLGPVPVNPNKTIQAMSVAVETVSNTDPDVDTIDTATVLVLAHVMMAMLLKKFNDAKLMLHDMLTVGNRATQAFAGYDYIHRGPMEAMSMALSIISSVEVTGGEKKDEMVDEMLRNVFAVSSLPVLADERGD